MNSEAVDEMLSSMRKHTMDRLLELIDAASDAAYKGDVKEVQRITKEAVFRVETVSDALFRLISSTYGAEEAVVNKEENERFKNNVLEGFCDKLALAMHIRNEIEKGIPEA